MGSDFTRKQVDWRHGSKIIQVRGDKLTILVLSAAGATPSLCSVCCHYCSVGSFPSIYKPRSNLFPLSPLSHPVLSSSFLSDTLVWEDSVLPSVSSAVTDCLPHPIAMLGGLPKLDLSESLVIPHLGYVAASCLPCALPRASPLPWLLLTPRGFSSNGLWRAQSYPEPRFARHGSGIREMLWKHLTSLGLRSLRWATGRSSCGGRRLELWVSGRYFT